MVFSNVGGSGLEATVLISSSSCSIPASKAGGKCSISIALKSGASKGRELGEKSGLLLIWVDLLLLLLQADSAMLPARMVISNTRGFIFQIVKACGRRYCK